jgi:hypothetical protein
VFIRQARGAGQFVAVLPGGAEDGGITAQQFGL